ncbi:hypothetical protein [Pseudoduganella sp. HUAS MS19]
MKSIPLLILVLLIGEDVSAQSVPVPILQLSSHGDKLIPKGTLTKEQNDFFWKDTTKSREGYLQIKSPPEAMEIVVQAKALANQAPPDELSAIVNQLATTGLNLVGNFKESINRHNLVFSNSQGLLMLTVWDYQKDGASITEMEEFFTSKIKGSPAVLSLLYNDAHDKLLWKATWSKDGRQYELFIEDVRTRQGDPTRRPDSVLTMAASIMPASTQ